ncbi:MAG: hypothetical protein C1943_01025 [Halochromatium sp.]|nr:hypothetical protein [Halochromatium sp.]
MPSADAERLTITTDAYLAGEKLADIRHEYIDGERYAMAGGSDAHAFIGLNAAALLKSHLRGSGCRTYLGEMKAQADDTKYLYPDVMVTCDDEDRKRNHSKRHLLLIIEVLSNSKEAYDRGKKVEYYRQMDSLREYVLIDQSEYHVDLFRKNTQQRWELFSFAGEDAELCLSSLDACFRLADLYEDVDFALALAEPRSGAE